MCQYKPCQLLLSKNTIANKNTCLKTFRLYQLGLRKGPFLYQFGIRPPFIHGNLYQTGTTSEIYQRKILYQSGTDILYIAMGGGALLGVFLGWPGWLDSFPLKTKRVLVRSPQILHRIDRNKLSLLKLRYISTKRRISKSILFSSG